MVAFMLWFNFTLGTICQFPLFDLVHCNALNCTDEGKENIKMDPRIKLGYDVHIQTTIM